MDTAEPLVYVASEAEGEEWVEARVISRDADGTVTLETLESKETRTQSADVSAAAPSALMQALTWQRRVCRPLTSRSDQYALSNCCSRIRSLATASRT